MKHVPAILLTLPFLLFSCSGDGGGKKTSSTDGSGFKPFSERMGDTMSGRDGGYSKDPEGNFVPSSKKRSSFEHNRDSKYFKGDYAKKDFKTNDYSKKSWWGDTQYESKKYEGDTDGSRFQTSSKFQGAGAREANTAADLPGNYKTGNYATSSAREATSRRIDKPSDAETDIRRRVYSAPSVVDWKEQRGMSVSDTKGFLGR